MYNNVILEKEIEYLNRKAHLYSDIVLKTRGSRFTRGNAVSIGTYAGCVFKCQGGMPRGPGFHAEQGVHVDTPSGQQQR